MGLITAIQNKTEQARAKERMLSSSGRMRSFARACSVLFWMAVIRPMGAPPCKV